MVHWLYVSIFDHHIGIPSLVARLLPRTKQDTKTCMLRDNADVAHYCYGCYGGTHLPSPTRDGDSGRRKLRIDSSLGYWSYLHPSRGHSSILMRFHKSDPILNMRVDVMRLTLNAEPRHMVIMLTREEWTMGPGTPPGVKGIIWYTDASRTRGGGGGTGAGVYGLSLARRLSNSIRKYAIVFQRRHILSGPVLMTFMWTLAREIGYYLL